MRCWKSCASQHVYYVASLSFTGYAGEQLKQGQECERMSQKRKALTLMGRSGWYHQGTPDTSCLEHPWGRRRQPVNWRTGRTPGNTCLPGRQHMSPHWQPAHMLRLLSAHSFSSSGLSLRQMEHTFSGMHPVSKTGCPH